MTTWTYDLMQITDPHLRLGLHGLWRMLHYCQDPNYAHHYDVPTGLKWEIVSDTKIEITFEEEKDIVALVAAMLGRTEHGLLVPPGYSDEPNSPAIYFTGLAHKGISQCFMGSPVAASRSWSLSNQEKKDKPSNLEIFRKTHPDDDIWYSVGTATFTDRKGKVKSRAIKFSPHTTDPKLRKPLNPFKTSAGPLHPAFKKLNNMNIAFSPEDKLLLAFVPIAFLYVSTGDCMVGLGVDLPTFSEADLYHSRCQNGKTKVLRYVSGTPDLAVVALATHHDLPLNRTYQATVSTGPSFFPFLFTGKQEKLYQAIRGSISWDDTQKTIKALRDVPVLSVGKNTYSALDVLRRNMSLGLPWSLGFTAIPGVKNWYGFNSTILQIIIDALETPMEQQYREQIQRALRWRQQWHHQNGRDNPWDRARQDFTLAFRNAKSRTGAMSAIAQIVEMVGQTKGRFMKDGKPQGELRTYQPFTAEVLDFVMTTAATDPTNLHSLTILALYARSKKAEKATEGGESKNTSSSETMVAPDENLPDEELDA